MRFYRKYGMLSFVAQGLRTIGSASHFALFCIVVVVAQIFLVSSPRLNALEIGSITSFLP